MNANKGKGKGKEKKTKAKKETTNDGEDKSYLRWGLEMERALANILRDQRNLGYKGDGGWKTIAYNNASSILTAQFNTLISAENVKNRVKTWKRIYAIVSGILGQSGFNWDSSKYMITVDDENAWNDYVKVQIDASKYRYKVIVNWDDIVDLCGKDRATGEGAENATDADEVMSNEGGNDSEGLSGTKGIDDLIIGDDSSSHSEKKRGQSSSTSTMPPSKKRGGNKDTLSSVVFKVASSLEEYMRSTAKKVDVGEVYDEVNAISDLDESDCLRALDWLVDNENKFSLLKKLPLEKKKNFILMCMPRKDYLS